MVDIRPGACMKPIASIVSRSLASVWNVSTEYIRTVFNSIGGSKRVMNGRGANFLLDAETTKGPKPWPPLRVINTVIIDLTRKTTILSC